MKLTAIFLVLSLPVAAQRFPKPEPDRAFAEMKVYENGSAVRAAREDWDGARARVKADAEWAAWLAKSRAETDEWISAPRDKVEYVAGWWHDFVNEKDGGFLNWTPMPPGGVTAKVFGGWVFGLRSRNGDRMVEAARLWRLTGERKYLDWAASQLDFYAENLMKWPAQGGGNARLMYQSLDDANMLVRFVQTARIIGDDADAARRRAWIEKLMRPMAELLGKSLQRVHNIACWQRAAMAMAAMYAKDDELWKLSVDGEYGIRRQVRDGITSDYLWVEQSLLYNSYVVSSFLTFLEYAGMAGRLDELKQEAAAIENLMLAPIYLRFPDGKLPTPADSTAGFRRAPEMGILARARRVFPTTLGIGAASAQKSWDTLLDPAPAVKPAPLPEIVSRNFESSRMALLKKGPWQVFFHYGQLDPSHAQAEALNYEAYFELIDVTHDAGTVGYGSPLHKGFFQTGAAHNTVLIDGQGQAKWNPGTLIGFDGAAGMAVARQDEFRPGVAVTRKIEIDGKKLIEKTEVRCAGEMARRIGLVLQVQGKVQVPAGATPAADVELPYWREARSWDGGRKVELTFTAGGRQFALTIESGDPLRVTHAVTPDAPPKTRESLYLETTGQSAAFRTTWQPR
ncbi:MAG: heparinase [Candidatus Solibacter sp.]|nr:heparinase [Candidatus Solibacter sp.]